MKNKGNSSFDNPILWFFILGKLAIEKPSLFLGISFFKSENILKIDSI
jgi:hypothetical protein